MHWLAVVPGNDAPQEGEADQLVFAAGSTDHENSPRPVQASHWLLSRPDKYCEAMPDTINSPEA